MPLTDMPVGEALRRARLHYGQSVEDVARALNIRIRQVEALESGDIAALPAPVYAIGFMRAYAEHLGLDAAQVVALFKAQAREAVIPRTDLNFRVPASDSALAPWWMAFLGIAVGALLIGLWIFWQDKDVPLNISPPEVQTPPSSVPANPPPPSVAVETSTMTPSPAVAMGPVQPPTPVPVSVSTPAPVPDSMSALAPVPDSMSAPVPVSTTARMSETVDVAVSSPLPIAQDILLTVTADSWVEVRDASGAAIVARVLKKGDRYAVPSRPDLVMTLGNAAGIEISIDKEILAPLGAQGAIVRGVPLDATILRERYGTQ